MKELFQRTKKSFSAEKPDTDVQVPDNMWVKCPSCKTLLYQKQLNENFKVCPVCGHHMRLDVHEWLSLLDVGSFGEKDADLWPTDPLEFVSLDEPYDAKLKKTQQRTGALDAIISGLGTIDGQPLALTVCNFSFMGASMGSVYGEKITRAAERAATMGIPLLTINSSGGARMQEGLVSLMQMAKVTMALTRLSQAKQPHISLLTNPCYGGVTASYASVADIIIAEPGANIGFAGKRVIEQTIRQQLPPDFQTAEFMLDHGMIDMVVERNHLRETLAQVLRLYRRSPSDAPLQGTEKQAQQAER